MILYYNNYHSKTALKKLLFFIALLLIFTFFHCAQKPSSLPRSTPEAEGVSSTALERFIDAVCNSEHEFHSFMLLRHGKVIAECWWNPYRPDLKHTLYSASKSFTATAVGFAVSENKLSVKDKVISFFPEDLPDTVSTNLSEMSVADLLSMSAGQQPDPTYEVAAKHDNWIKAFLSTPVIHEPGTRFLYNSAATFMLSAIVQTVNGEKVIDYLTPRLFEPLGIEEIDWETNPSGMNTGGWGLRVKTEDMAKFGQLFLQKGMWQGKQILPALWIEEASSIKIEQAPDATQARKDSSDWLQGYCYQMWHSRHNSFRADGAFGQFILILPEEDAVIAITAETPDMQSEINLVWNYILPAFDVVPLPADEDALKKLTDKMAALALPIPKGEKSPMESTLSGKTFDFETNANEIKCAGFTFENGSCQLALTINSTAYGLLFGSGRWLYGETTKFGPYLAGAFRNNRVGLPPFKVAGSYYWSDPNTLVLTLRYIESPHTETIQCRFEQEKLIMDFEESFRAGQKVMTCAGQMRK